MNDPSAPKTSSPSGESLSPARDMDVLDVLIVGAGPTGLVLALWLTRVGIRVRIIDKTAEAGTTSRALAVQARTLEFYEQLGIADAVVAAGRKMLAANVWVKGKRVAHAVFGEMGVGISPFPYALIYPQDEHERLLIARLAEAGVEVERQTELLRFEETADGVVGHLRHADGTEENCTAAYIAGCDGARSTMREALGIGFPGGTYEHMFYVADVQASGETMNGELHVAMDRADFLVVFPLKERRARAADWNDTAGTGSAGREADLGGREQSRDRCDANRCGEGELVLDLPRAPSRGGSLSQGTRIFAGGCGAHP